MIYNRYSVYKVVGAPPRTLELRLHHQTTAGPLYTSLPTCNMEKDHVAPTFRNGPKDFQIHTLATPDDQELLCPIRYIYNYLPRKRKWLKPQPISLSRIFADSNEGKATLISHQLGRTNSILLHTQAANLPLHTGLEDFRQNKYWRANETATRDLLKLFATDHYCSEVVLSDKRSMSGLAEDQLKTAIIDTYSRFSVYMFTEADENRIQLIAQSVILIFAFDGKASIIVSQGYSRLFKVLSLGIKAC